MKGKNNLVLDIGKTVKNFNYGNVAPMTALKANFSECCV